MAINKSSSFNQRSQDLAGYASAVAHPAKVILLERLALYGTQTCGELANALPLAQSTVSQHLKSLTRSGLIVMEVDGLKSNYSLDLKSVEEMRTRVDELMNKLSNPMI
ncbi:MAG: transcriptional regulator [Balneolaceae bacterium]|nr:MAG: transcriptional regulator [Balneolaceae bacterium]